MRVLINVLHIINSPSVPIFQLIKLLTALLGLSCSLPFLSLSLWRIISIFSCNSIKKLFIQRVLQTNISRAASPTGQVFAQLPVSFPLSLYLSLFTIFFLLRLFDASTRDDATLRANPLEALHF